MRALLMATVLLLPGWLGLGYTYHRSANGTRWLHVQRLAPDGPAAKAGLRVQDVVTAIDNKPLRFVDDKAVVAHFKSIKPGQEVRFTVTREGKPQVIKVKAIELPKQYYELWKQNEERAKEKN